MRLLVAATLLVLLLLPSAARGAPVARADALWDGPRIVDGGVAWLEQSAGRWSVRATRDGRELVAAQGGFPADDLETDDGDDDIATAGVGGGFTAGGAVATLELRSSGGNTKASQYNTTSDVRRIALQAGAGAAALATCTAVTDTFGGDGSDVPAAVATDGRAIAVNQCAKTRIFDAASGAQVAEFDVQATPPVTGTVRDVSMAIAGRHLAYADRGQVVVRDWQAGTEAYRVPLAKPPAATAFDVQEDGALGLVTFAEQTPSCGDGTLTWHTAAAPAGVPLPAVACSDQIAVDGGRAAVVAEAPGGQVVAEVAPDGTRRDLAWLGTGRSRRGGIDYLAGTAAYGLERCGGGETVQLSTGAATPEPVDCPRIELFTARVRGRALRVEGDMGLSSRVRLRVAYRAAGRTFRRRVRTSSGGRFSTSLPLPARASRRSGRLTVTYAGDDTYLPETARRRVRAPRRR